MCTCAVARDAFIIVNDIQLLLINELGYHTARASRGYSELSIYKGIGIGTGKKYVDFILYIPTAIPYSLWMCMCAPMPSESAI